MRCAVDEVRPGDYGGGKTDCGPVEGGNEDFGVRGEGVRYGEVVGDEAAEPVVVGVGGGGEGTGYGYVCSAGGLNEC